MRFRADLAKLAKVIIYHPTLLQSDGYGVTYIFEAPDQQTATFFSAGTSAEFDEIAVDVDRGDVAEVRTSKTGEPSALIIRHGQTGLVAIWDLSAMDKIPPSPSDQEVRRRFELGVSLFNKTQDALGLKNFKGGETGTIDIRLDGVEDLTLVSRGAENLFTYTFTDLGQEGMIEDLIAESTSTTITISVSPDRIVVERRDSSDGRKVVAELTMAGTTWRASRETSEPGGRTAREDLTRADAERLLADGLRELEQARRYLGIPFGRSVSGITLP